MSAVVSVGAVGGVGWRAVVNKVVENIFGGIRFFVYFCFFTSSFVLAQSVWRSVG